MSSIPRARESILLVFVLLLSGCYQTSHRHGWLGDWPPAMVEKAMEVCKPYYGVKYYGFANRYGCVKCHGKREPIDLIKD